MTNTNHKSRDGRKLITIALTALCLLVIAFSLAGCSGSAGGAPNGGSAPPETVSAPPSETKNTPGSDAFNFADLNGWEFEFTSGAGGWMTILTITPDGTFSGEFHDSEMGAAGEDYPDGTIYVCDFSGKFASIEKIGDYEYSIKCETLAQEGVEGGEEIIGGIKYITSTPYGFDDADEFRLYLPGKKTSDLPEEYLEWVRSAIADEDELSFYGLYNVGGKQGFSSYNIGASSRESGTATETEAYPETMLTFDSEGFEQMTHNMYALNDIFFVTLEVEPLAETVYGEESVLERVKELEGSDLRDLRASESEEISARLTFPAWLIYYDKGENEDTEFCIDLYFQSNRAEYRVHIAVKYATAAEYEDVIQRVLDTVEVSDASIQ